MKKGGALTFSAEASTEDGTGILDFGSIRTGEESSVEQQYIYVKNTGTGSLNFESIHPEHFMVQDIKDTLEPGNGVRPVGTAPGRGSLQELMKTPSPIRPLRGLRLLFRLW